MASPVGSLVVRIGADLSELQAGVAKAQTHLGKLGSSMRTGIGIAAKYGAAMVTAAAALGTVLVKNAGAAAKEIENLSTVANANAEVFQRNAYAAKLFGVESEKLADIYKDVGDKVGDFLNTGGGPMADFFEKIGPRVGVTAEQFRNLSGPNALQLYVSSLEKANLSQNEMTFYMEALASDATRLLPLLRNNGKEMAALGDEAQRLGGVLSEIDIQQLSAAHDAMARISAGVRALGNNIAVALAPYIEQVAELILKIAGDSEGFKDKIQAAFEGGAKFAAAFADVIQGLRVVFKGLELVVTGFGATVATVFELAIREVFGFATKVNSAVNFAINQLNRIPKVDIELLETDASQFGVVKFVSALGDAMREQTSEVRSELHDLAMQELPSDKVKKFLDEVKNSSVDAAAAVVQAKQEMAGVGSGVSHQDDMAAEEAAARKEALAEQLENLRSHLMSESELETKAHQDRFQALQKSLDEGLLEEGEFQKLKEEMALQHQDRMAEITGKEEEARREGIAGKLLALQESLMSEAEIEVASYKERLQTLIDALETRMLTEDEYRVLREQAEVAHQERLAAIENEGLSRRLAFEKMTMQQKSKLISQELANITAGVSQHSRKMFELNKVAGIANAIINAYEGISLTMKSYPYPINIGMAAAHAAAAFAQVSAIKSASFGGGSAPSIAGSTPATPVSPVSSGAPSQLGGARLAVEGIDLNSLFTGRTVRELAERLKEHIADGGDVVFV